MRTITGFGVIGVSFAAGLAGMWALDRGAAPTVEAATDQAPPVEKGPRVVKPGAVRVDLHVMSQCPYGVQAEAAFAEAVDKLGPDLDLRLEFIGDVNGDQLGSMHGPTEVRGDLAQVCAMEHVPRWYELVLCQNEDMKSVADNWQACGRKVDADVDALAACVNGPEGKELLAASFKRSAEKGADGSPTIFIAGKPYEGNRRPSDVMRAICGAYTGEVPAACADLPEQPKVNVTLLGDKRCGAECDLASVESRTRSIIGAPVITKLDVSEPEGKKLADKLGKVTLPAVLFDATLDADTEAAKQIVPGLKDVGGHRLLELGEWNPRCADDGGCKLEECKSKLSCRKEEKAKLELFVMSQCPYGVKGLDAMKAVLAHLDAHGDKITFDIHYIGGGDAASGFTALHGPPEVAENMRQICAMEHFGKGRKFMDYIWCRNPNIRDAAWQSCAGAATGVDEGVVQACVDGPEGPKLLAASYATSSALGIGGSPTWIANGRYQFSGIDAPTIMGQLCAHNDLKACKVPMAAMGGAVPAEAPAGAGAPAPGCE